MVNIKKRTNQIIAITALGLGAYALLKGTGVIGGDDKGEGSIGGTDDQFSEDQGFRNIAADPNTIPEQPITNIQDYSYSIPTDYIIPPQNIQTINPLEPIITPYSPVTSGSSKIDTQTSGLFGSGISAGEAALGVAGFLPSAFTKFGEKVGSKSDNILKRTIPEAVEETPFIGKKLADVYKPTTDIATKPLLQESTEGVLKFGTTEVVEAGAKTGLKQIGKTGAKVAVGAIPLIGTAAGAEFDVAVDNRSRPVAYTANVLGDVVGGVLGGITSPLALTGIGAAVPVALTVGGQIATESLVYGISDTLGGAGRVDQKAVDSALALQYSGTTTANIPTGSSYTFTLTDSAKSKLELEDEKVNKSFWDFTSGKQNTGALYSSTSTPVLSSTSKGGNSKTTQTVVTPISSGVSSSKDTYKAVSGSKSGVIGQWTNTAGEVTGIKISTATSSSSSSSKSNLKTDSLSGSNKGKGSYVVTDKSGKKTKRYIQ